MTALSRLLGLLRDVSFAIFIGAGANADAFFIAFKIPNFLRRLFAEGAFSQAFVPVLAEHREREERTGQPQVQALVDRVAGGLAGVLLAVTSLAVVAAPLVAALFAPGFVSQPYKDRKSTRLNSSHVAISYAVFCLKKKKHQQISFYTSLD